LHGDMGAFLVKAILYFKAIPLTLLIASAQNLNRLAFKPVRLSCGKHAN
jgi:hypothetical protein